MKSLPRMARSEKAMLDTMAATNCSMLKFCRSVCVRECASVCVCVCVCVCVSVCVYRPAAA